MRKRIFVGGIALCLALSVAGCGKSSEEQQAVNYYQDELGLDREEAEELAHEIYGEDEEDEEEPSVTEETPEEIVVEPLPELVNSEWYERKVQIYDMVFDNYDDITEEDIRKTVEGSSYDVELGEGFDENGEVCIDSLIVDGKRVAQIWKHNWTSDDHVVKYGLRNEGYSYWIGYGSAYMENNWFDKESTEFEDLKTMEDVLAYLADNGFVEVEEDQATYHRYDSTIIDHHTDHIPVEFADTPHYYRKGAQSITFYRIFKLSETDQEVQYGLYDYSGAQLNLVNRVSFEFNTDGTMASPMSWKIKEFIIMGEEIR